MQSSMRIYAFQRSIFELGARRLQCLTYLNDAATHAILVQEVVAEAKELRAPVHDDLLELRTCGAAEPLSRAQRWNIAYSRHERTLKPGLDTLDA